MEIIHPNEIGVKISTLIAESKDFFYAVSPFIKISQWKKMTSNLVKAQNRGVTIKIFYREINDVEYNFLKFLDIEFYQIDCLHTKLYMNENSVVMGSMNLYDYSDVNSIELGAYYNDKENYNKFYEYFNKFIIPLTATSPAAVLPKLTTDLKNLHNYLIAKFSNCRFVLASSYIFSKQLIHPFHVMISENDITLKLPYRRPEIERIELIDGVFKKSDLSINIHFNPPEENYKYATWRIAIGNLAQVEIFNIIISLKNINFLVVTNSPLK